MTNSSTKVIIRTNDLVLFLLIMILLLIVLLRLMRIVMLIVLLMLIVMLIMTSTLARDPRGIQLTGFHVAMNTGDSTCHFNI